MYDRSAVEVIERAQTTRPFCPCGRHTVAVWRDGAVWLECALVVDPPEGRLARLAASLSAAHVHQRIMDVPPAEHVAA